MDVGCWLLAMTIGYDYGYDYGYGCWVLADISIISSGLSGL